MFWFQSLIGNEILTNDLSKTELNPTTDFKMGQGTNEKQYILNITKSLSELMIDHVKYLSGLSHWKQYMVWRYTLGSGSINMNLLGIIKEDRVPYWVYLFFDYYNAKTYGTDNIEKPFDKYKVYFKFPFKYLKHPIEKQLEIAKDILGLYAESLIEIIYNSPPTTGDIVVYKSSLPYPGIPTEVGQKDILVKQELFNSTSYDPQFNYYMFMNPEGSCCAWRITIPKGSHVLLIGPPFHAYPSEREILLPFGVSLDVKSTEIMTLNYSKSEDPPFI